VVPNQSIPSADAQPKDLWKLALFVILFILSIGSAALLMSVKTYFSSKDNPPRPSEVESTALLPEPMSHAPEEYTDTDPTKSIVLADMRMVSTRLKDDSVEERLVHVEHVNRLVGAIIQLHCIDKSNPYSEEPVEELDTISVSAPEFDGPYWWSTPSLSDSPDNLHDGAMVIRWNIEKVWTIETGWTYTKPPPQGF
jgi:hypothetical protein